MKNVILKKSSFYCLLLIALFTLLSDKSFAQISSKIAFNYDESIIYMGSERYGFTGNGSFRFGHGSTDPSNSSWKEILRIDYGGLRLFDANIYLRGANDYNHGLKYAGSNFFPVPANTVVDGPVLFGWDGGALASTNHQYPQIALRWNAAGNVGIGTNTPNAKLDVIGDINSNKIAFPTPIGDGGTGEYIQNTKQSSSDPWGLSFFTGNANRMTILTNGNTHINDNTLYFRGITDTNHGLGWYGAGKLFAGTNVNGPVLFGNGGGALGTINAGTNHIALSWNVNGNVGIGTSTPNAPLQFANTISQRKVVLYEESNNDHQFYGLGLNAAVLRYQVAHVNADHAFYSGSGTSNSAELLRIKGSGNVGVGTASPSQKLEVNGNIKSTGVDFLLDNNSRRSGATGDSRRALVHDGNDVLTINFANDYTGGVKVGQDIYFAPDPTNASKLKLGIGTTPTKGKLHVKGSMNVENAEGTQVFHISAEKQLVFVGDSAWTQYNTSLNLPNSPIQQNKFSLWVSKGIVTQDLAIVNPADWSDFVFEKDYQLRSLEEVAAYIKKNGHLPEMPSEVEVKAQGYSVHDINKKLLQKIEELTLYAIQQDEKIKAQEKQFNSLEQRIKQLEANK